MAAAAIVTYEAVAARVRPAVTGEAISLDPTGTLYATAGARHVVLALADYFAEDSPRFDRAQFLEAAGVTR